MAKTRTHYRVKYYTTDGTCETCRPTFTSFTQAQNYANAINPKQSPYVVTLHPIRPISRIRVDIDIKTANAAFQDDPNEAGRIIGEAAELAQRAANDPIDRDTTAKLRDMNGNEVGRVQIRKTY